MFIRWMFYEGMIDFSKSKGRRVRCGKVGDTARTEIPDICIKDACNVNQLVRAP